MLSQDDRNDIHQRVLENAYVFLNAAGAINKEMNLGRELEIRVAMNKAEQVLQRTYSSDDLSYADYSDVSELARDISRQLWNPNGDTEIQKIAIYVPGDANIGWSADNDTKSPIIEVPHRMAEHLERDLEEFDALKISSLSPYEQKVRQLSAKSARAGVMAYDNLANLALAGRELLDEESENRLPKLSVEFVSEPALRVFLRSSAAMGALPEDSEPLSSMIEMAGKRGKIDDESIDRAIAGWSNDRPAITRPWIRHACEALATTASSTKMDTLTSSSTEKIQEIISQVYSERLDSGIGHRFQIDQAENNKDSGQLTEALESIEESISILASGEKGDQVPATLMRKITQEAENLRDLVRAADASKGYNLEDEVYEYPSL